MIPKIYKQNLRFHGGFVYAIPLELAADLAVSELVPAVYFDERGEGATTGSTRKTLSILYSESERCTVPVGKAWK